MLFQNVSKEITNVHVASNVNNKWFRLFRNGRENAAFYQINATFCIPKYDAQTNLGRAIN